MWKKDEEQLAISGYQTLCHAPYALIRAKEVVLYAREDGRSH